MKVAKPTEQIINDVKDFREACELCLEREDFSIHSPEERWKHYLEPDDPIRQWMELTREAIAEEEGIRPESVDNRIVCFEYLKRKYSNRLSHIIMCLDILMDNCCDPTEDSLEFRPDIYFQHVAPEQ